MVLWCIPNRVTAISHCIPSFPLTCVILLAGSHLSFLSLFLLLQSRVPCRPTRFWLPSFSFLFIVGFGYLSLKSMIIVVVLAKLITVGFDWQSACIWSCVESILRHRWVFRINIFVCRVCLDGLLYWRFINPKSSAWRHSCVSFLSSFKLAESLNSLLQVCAWNLYWRLLYIFASLCYSVEYCEHGAWLLLYYVHEAWSLKHDGVDKKLLIEVALSTAWRMPEDWVGCVEEIEDCCMERMMEHWRLGQDQHRTAACYTSVELWPEWYDYSSFLVLQNSLKKKKTRATFHCVELISHHCKP